MVISGGTARGWTDRSLETTWHSGPGGDEVKNTLIKYTPTLLSDEKVKVIGEYVAGL